MSNRKYVLTDEDKIWFGIHKGTKLKNIPDYYFQYLLNNNISFKGIKHYSKVFRGLSHNLTT
jgi:hypothetical protein